MSLDSASAREFRQFAFGGALMLFAALANATALFGNVDGSLAAGRPAGERYAQVTLDAVALGRLESGAIVSAMIPGVGRFDYVVQQRSLSKGLTVLEATLRDDPVRRLTIGLRGRNVSAYIDTPNGGFVLGYANQTHWLGVAGKEYPAQPSNAVTLLSERAPEREATSAGDTEQPPVPEAKPIDVNVAGLTELTAGSEANLPLPRLGDVSVVYEKTLTDAPTPTWVGYLRDYGKDYRVVLTFGTEGTQGHILAPSGEYLVMPGQGGDWLVDAKASGLVEPNNPNCAVGEVAADAAIANDSAQSGTAAASAVESASSSAKTVIDVLVLYTQDMVTKYGSVAAVKNRISHLAALSNLAYSDGSVPIQLRVVRAQQLTVPIATSNTTALSQLRSGAAPFSSVSGLRSKYGADLVTLLRPFRRVQQENICGSGYVGGYNGSDMSRYASTAYTVVADGTDMGGSNYYCQDYTFTHELGHNMGLMHDRATVARSGGGMGAYPHAFGYGKSNVFGTIMSYIQPRIGRFSNPQDRNCAGQACGVAASNTASSADNAQALRMTRVKVAAYQSASASSSATTTFAVTGAVTVGGARRSGVSISSTNANAICGKTGATGLYLCNVPAGASTVLRPVLNGVTFNPATRTVSSISGNLAGYNFSGN